MGFFSWKTSDTGRSIANEYQDAREVFTVFMHDDKGKVWIEESYGGYGVFGGKDYYELLAEMNGFTPDDVEALDREGINVYNDFRGIGISLQFHPDLVEDEYFRPHDTAVISVPQKAPEGSTLRTESAFQLLERVKFISENYVKAGHRSGMNTHNVSATISVRS